MLPLQQKDVFVESEAGPKILSGWQYYSRMDCPPDEEGMSG
jgi:hypothetical protein